MIGWPVGAVIGAIEQDQVGIPPSPLLRTVQPVLAEERMTAPVLDALRTTDPVLDD